MGGLRENGLVRIIASIVLVVVAAAPAHAEVYRWTDEHGRVHFGDRPPVGQGEQVETPPPPAPDKGEPRPANVPDRQRLLDMYQREREERQAAKAKQAKARAARERECREIAQALRRYQAGGPLYEDRPGGRHYFTAAEKDAEMAQFRGILAKQCGGVPADLQPRQGR